MQKKQSWEDIDETLAKQPKIRMPNRRALAMWSSFDLARFRGGEEDWDDWDEEERGRAGDEDPKLDCNLSEYFCEF